MFFPFLAVQHTLSVSRQIRIQRQQSTYNISAFKYPIHIYTYSHIYLNIGRSWRRGRSRSWCSSKRRTAGDTWMCRKKFIIYLRVFESTYSYLKYSENIFRKCYLTSIWGYIWTLMEGGGMECYTRCLLYGTALYIQTT